jgi:hypothetical protein
MLDEEEKRLLIVNRYSFSQHSLIEMTHGVPDFAEYVTSTVDFVRYLPNCGTSDIQNFRHGIKPKIADSTYMASVCGGIQDMEAIAYILFDGFPKWICADIARVYAIDCGHDVYMLAYNNVFMHRRKRWGMFL